MIIYKCDVCATCADAPTAAWDMRHCPPLGWFTRRGMTKAMYEVNVVVCSKTCGDAYDLAEVEQVGLSWSKVIVITDDSDFKGIFPLKVGAAL